MVFFGWKKIGLALVDIVMLVGTLLATIFRFYDVDEMAAWLLVPYLVWVSFATLLNFAIWRLNGDLEENGKEHWD